MARTCGKALIVAGDDDDDDDDDVMERRMEEMEARRREEVEAELRGPVEKVLRNLDFARSARLDSATAAWEISEIEIKTLEHAERLGQQVRSESAEDQVLQETLSCCRRDPRIEVHYFNQCFQDSYGHRLNAEAEEALNEEIQSEGRREQHVAAQEMACQDKAWLHHVRESERRRTLRKALQAEAKLIEFQERCRSLHEEEAASRSNFEEGHVIETIARSEEEMLWRRNDALLDAASDRRRLEDLRLKRIAEQEEEARLQQSVKVYMENLVQEAMKISLRGERERREKWNRIHEIRSARLKLRRKRAGGASEAQQNLQRLGLQNADEETLSKEEKKLLAELDKNCSELGRNMSYSMEDWIAKASKLEDVFFQSRKPSSLLKYLDEWGSRSRGENTREREERREKPVPSEKQSTPVPEELRERVQQLWDDIVMLISYSSTYELSEQDAELLLRLSRVWTRVTVLRSAVDPSILRSQESWQQRENPAGSEDVITERRERDEEQVQGFVSFREHIHIQVQECEAEIASLKMVIQDLVDINKALQDNRT
ncbi:hypothetical protein GUITHDRAFT_110310 [Guillardia theta CCMP2712]|uniref:Uncharacterized protein n=1 Tax=Guillardia theta (strain CCMP2712) TaxID=905079 RepID=L1J707_GUITC|nr:hypothetical protein GUITHDRAFT_110310 [Guillardia theta CCMP2712]EKX43860.1 hypothetical protein GUITHDRAFT_110310 [Guillardia theta CCMP2712]|eukprot:XP_005830840.1 hypothetical protein GUITHDRAFT_110310 [Guillardia theta CCMP2712]